MVVNHTQSQILEVKNLVKLFPMSGAKTMFRAVDDVSFQLKHGEVLGLLGPNGAGKTTIIQMLLSTLTPTSGSIDCFGKNFFTNRSECLQEISFASTYVNFPTTLTAAENLSVYGRIYGLSGAELARRIDRYLNQFGIEQLKHKKVGTFSAGQKTRLMLCKAFLNNPKILLLDEPTASLDPVIAHEVRTFILQQQKEYGMSIIFTSHNMDEVTAVCNRILFLAAGKIIADDTPQRLAASVNRCQVTLQCTPNNTERATHYLQNNGYTHSIDKQTIHVHLDEGQISQVLHEFAKQDIHYLHISIEKPSLEDYFLQIARSKRSLS